MAQSPAPLRSDTAYAVPCVGRDGAGVTASGPPHPAEGLRSRQDTRPRRSGGALYLVQARRGLPAAGALARVVVARDGAARARERAQRWRWPARCPTPRRPCSAVRAHGREMERLGEEYVAELSCIHLYCRPGIQRTPNAWRDGLVADATDPRRDLPGAACLG